MRRREVLAGAAALSLAMRLSASRASAQEAPAAPPAPEGTPFSRSVVLERARTLATQPFATPEPPLPDAVLNLSASDYAAIRYRDDRRLFIDPPTGFGVDLVFPGFIYNLPVEFYAVGDGLAYRIAYDPSLFSFGDVPPPAAGPEMDFAGFRAFAPLNGADNAMVAFLAFAGATYFRALARGQEFGLSARGLAIGTGDPEGEEFPFFRAHWVETPSGDRMVIHSLLDGPSATAAFRFTVQPGDVTQMDVEATIFAREDIGHIGLAPLTSMFLFDAKDRVEHDDFRLGVHDSDGLAMWNGSDERLWRPLHAPRLLQISAFSDESPRGFGLIQRERRFSEYEDLSQRYHKRPSAWVEPIGAWGRGHVMLVEIPSTEEVHDNIVAYWRPADPVPKGSELSLTYRLIWGWDVPDLNGLLRVARTLSGSGPDGRRRFVIDYSGDGQPAPRASAVQVMTSANPGAIVDTVIEENPEVGGLRLRFDLDPQGANQVEMRVDLRSGDRAVAETWVYRWSN